MLCRDLFAFSLCCCALASAEDGAILRDGFQLHYRTEGRGKPVVMLSGGPGIEVTYMKELAAALPARFEYVYLEQRGTGRSRPAKLTAENMKLQLAIEDLDALRQHLNLDRLFLVGHSWGGMLAMAYADKYPGRVDELILISSGGPTNEYENWFGDNIESRMRPEDTAMRNYWMESVKHGVEADKAFLEALRPVVPAYFFDRSKGLAFAAQLRDGDVHADTFNLISADRRKDYSLGPGLRKLDRPVLIIQGHQDPIGQKTAEDIHALIKSSMLRYIRRCGHFPWIEQPEDFRRIMADFLASQAGADSAALPPDRSPRPFRSHQH